MTQKSHDWTYTLRKPQFKKIPVPQCSLQHYLQQPGHGGNLDVSQQMNGWGGYGTYMQWDVTQPQKGTNLSPSEVNEARAYYTKRN